MRPLNDGPISPNTAPLLLRGNSTLAGLAGEEVSEEMKAALERAPGGACACRGIPFRVRKVVYINETRGPVTVKLEPVRTEWLVFMHISDVRPFEVDDRKLSMTSLRGRGRLAEHAADYVLIYKDGTEAKTAIRRRHEIGCFAPPWGEHCSESVPHLRPRPVNAHHEKMSRGWGRSQTRVDWPDHDPWINWLWAWKNPSPRKQIIGIRFEPVCGTVIIEAVSAVKASSHPLRWRSRRKAVLRLPRNTTFDPGFDESGLLKHAQLDLGQVISARERLLYPRREWGKTSIHQAPRVSSNELVVEYTAHEDARFHLPAGRTIPVARLEEKSKSGPLRVIAAAAQRVKLRVIESESGRCVPVRLHVHGEAGEYLAPIDRHRIPNPSWFEDYSIDYVAGNHYSTYIPGEAVIDLPIGNVYLEVWKGFEIKPVRKVVRVRKSTGKIVIKIKKMLPWREKGWVSADTHVHFLSPSTALLEGSGEGVNVVNLLASQWGELMTNVGDFDGRTTHGSKEAGGDGEYLVRVGTENRQHVLGHISLLGYEGEIIAPMTTGGPRESALGDPVGCLLTEWARKCRKQDGVVILPHFPNPRLEGAAAIVGGDIDGVEFWRGISPYSLLDWYRYLNCGYPAAAVGGTDKMSADVAIGKIRTYARINTETDFTYEAWKEAVRRARTFATCGPLMEFSVEGKPPGSRIKMKRGGGTVTVSWNAASVTMPMTKVELIVNGEVVKSSSVGAEKAEGWWPVKIEKSSWIALLIRGYYPGKPEEEIIAAHSSPIMVAIEGSPVFARADALTILEQIEGAMAYLDTVGTRAETKAYKRMRLILTAARRNLHNRMHQAGHYHSHTAVNTHPGHGGK